jgi:peptidoglycan/LPS O-acetylase OafA/YrhL
MRRVPELDSLRGVAAVVVLLFHLDPMRFQWGWSGVDLFFVLSGYLITAIILRHGNAPGFVLRFYARRSLRIWPIYYLTMVALVVANPFGPRPQPLDGWPYYATYTQNIWEYGIGRPAKFHIAFDHTWTLALEEQFYLLWPALVIWAGPRRVVRLCLATIAVAFLARRDTILAYAFSERVLIARCDGFALGGLLAAFLSRDRTARETALLRLGLAAGVLLGGGFLAWGRTRYGWAWIGLPTPAWPDWTILAFGVLYTGIIGLVALHAGRRGLAPLRLGPLVFLGQISYGLYLYHYPVYWFLDGGKFAYDQPPGTMALKLAASLAVATLSWYLIERPLLGLKDRFAYRPATPGEATPGVGG